MGERLTRKTRNGVFRQEQTFFGCPGATQEVYRHHSEMASAKPEAHQARSKSILYLFSHKNPSCYGRYGGRGQLVNKIESLLRAFSSMRNQFQLS